MLIENVRGGFLGGCGIFWVVMLFFYVCCFGLGGV